jgi:alanine racemase
MSALKTAILDVDLCALRHNYRVQRQRHSGSVLHTVVKANGYGVGAVRVARALAREGCTGFFVATPDEALELCTLMPATSHSASARQSSDSIIKTPKNSSPLSDDDKSVFSRDGARVFLLSGNFNRHVDALLGAVEHRRIVPCCGNLDQLNRWHALAQSLGRRLETVVHVDTGMARTGFECASVLDNLERVRELCTDGALDVLFVMSHFSESERRDSELNDEQLARFESVTDALGLGVPRSLSNSCGTLLGERYHFDIGRMGLAMHALHADDDAYRPVLRNSARVIDVRTVERGQPVGYNATWRAPATRRIATLAIGHADGIHQAASNRAHVCIDGVDRPCEHRAPIVGTVSMDLTTVDVTHIDRHLVVPGTTFATLWHNYATATAYAQSFGISNYELITRLGNRHYRRYIE